MRPDARIRNRQTGAFPVLKGTKQPRHGMSVSDDVGLQNRQPFGQCRVEHRFVEERAGELAIAFLEAPKEATQKLDGRMFSCCHLCDHGAPHLARLLRTHGQAIAEAHRLTAAVGSYQFRQERVDRALVARNVVPQHVDRLGGASGGGHIVVVLEVVYVVEIEMAAARANNKAANPIDEILRPEEFL